MLWRCIEGLNQGRTCKLVERLYRTERLKMSYVERRVILEFVFVESRHDQATFRMSQVVSREHE